MLGQYFDSAKSFTHPTILRCTFYSLTVSINKPQQTIEACWDVEINTMHSQLYAPSTLAEVRSRRIYSGQSGTGAGFLSGLRFPRPILIPPTAPYLLIILSPTLYGVDTDSVAR
jgi:hypothetical protein